LSTLQAVIVCQSIRPAQVSVAMPGRFIWHGTHSPRPAQIWMFGGLTTLTHADVCVW
jgi:hypothetical protein